MIAQFCKSKVLGAVILFAFLGALNVHAAAAAPAVGDRSKDEVVAYSTFSLVEESLTDEAMREDHAEQRSSTSSDPCKTFTYGVNGLTSTGAAVYTFEQIVGWCYNGSSISYHEYSYRPTINNPFYYYDGVSSESHQPGPGNSFWRDIVTARFVGNLAGYPLVTYSPYISMTVNANGTYNGSGTNGQQHIASTTRP